jgi:CRISPR-associated endonuclease/helicase Cas3
LNVLDSDFHALTGQTPFAWQRRLFERFAAGDVPDAIDLPTGLGKTKVMTLWLIARARGADLPRRLVYVVDRRAVVDQASTEAAELADRLPGWLAGLASGDAACFRRRLGLLRANEQLPISTLRGQHPDNRKWLESPGTAAIVVGTVDMIGSRLLFSGYGVSSGMRPAHAGLLGADTLVVLDEAHLVLPFQALLEQLAELAENDRASSGPTERPLVPRIRLLTLSATGRTRNDANLFPLTADDENDPPAAARLKAEKRARLLEEVTPAALVETLAERAYALAEGSRAVLAFCNSRQTAQRVAERLRRKPYGAMQVALLVGERRMLERERLTYPETDEGKVFARFDPRRHQRADSKEPTEPAFLIATSAGEVGVDIDADDLVCDLVAWERLVQRFGRVNRRPNPGRARIEIIPVADEKDAEDPIAKSRLAKLSAPFQSREWPSDDEGAKDASPLALRLLKDHPTLSNLLRQAESEEPLRPALTRPLVEAWAMTTLADHPGRPKIEPWLRGWIEREAQTALAWRALFPVRGRKGEFIDDPVTRARDVAAFFEAAPPHLTELLEAPTWRVIELLKKRAEAWKKGEEPSGKENAPADGFRHPPVVVALDRRGEFERLFTAEEIGETKTDNLMRSWAERTLIVDARLGGLDENGLLDHSASGPPPTLDRSSENGWTEERLQSVGFRVRLGERKQPDGDWRLGDFAWRTDADTDDSPELWVEVWRGAGATVGNAAIARWEQPLRQHHERAAAAAAEIADRLDIPEPYRGMLIAVAACHDAGKARELWQNAMRAPRNGRPYAKTKGGGDPKALGGYRHEFGSLADVASNSVINALPADVRDLALHLIASHHGHARPAIAAIEPDAPPSAPATLALARESALRFARLQRRWGPWGLAWWETLLRAADWEASRELNEGREHG